MVRPKTRLAVQLIVRFACILQCFCNTFPIVFAIVSMHVAMPSRRRVPFLVCAHRMHITHDRCRLLQQISVRRVVCLCVCPCHCACLLVTTVSPAERPNRSRCHLGQTRVVPRVRPCITYGRHLSNMVERSVIVETGVVATIL